MNPELELEQAEKFLESHAWVYCGAGIWSDAVTSLRHPTSVAYGIAKQRFEDGKKELNPTQVALRVKRLLLEEQMYRAQMGIGEIKRQCSKHDIIRGRLIWSPAKQRVVNTHEGLPDNWNDGCYSVSCSICGEEFGWHCPKNPKGYCEYEKNDYGCDFCGEPDERK